MTPDLQTLIATANDILKSLMPIFGSVLGLSLALGLGMTMYKEVRRAIKYSPVDSFPTKVKPQLDELPTADKPKNDRPVAGIGDDGELIFEGEEEPRYMRRIE